MAALEFLRPEADQVLCLVNPRAGARSQPQLVERLVHELAEQRLAAALVADPDELSVRVAESLSAGRLRAVVAAGGDGTVALAVNRTPAGTPIHVLPLGTENLLAKYLGLSNDPVLAAARIRAGATVRLDAGQAGERTFLLMLSCGFDAEVVRRLHSERAGHIHHLSYAKPILDTVRNYHYPELRIDCPSQAVPRRVRWAFVVNLPRYAVGLQIAPRATGTDGLLDVCAFREGSLWNALRYFGGVWFGQHESFPDCETFRSDQLRLEADEPVPYQLDGDPGGFLPVDIRVLRERLCLVVDRDWAERQGFV